MLRDAKKVTSPLLKSALVLLDIKAVRIDGKKLKPKSDEKKLALENISCDRLRIKIQEISEKHNML